MKIWFNVGDMVGSLYLGYDNLKHYLYYIQLYKIEGCMLTLHQREIAASRIEMQPPEKLTCKYHSGTLFLAQEGVVYLDC